jgi:hypothetical protein
MAENVTPNKPIGNVIPSGVQSVDPTSGIANSICSCQYTAISTSGTTTVSGNPCTYYAALCIALATATGGIKVLDGTNTLVPTATQTAVGGPTGFANLTPLGIRCLTSLVVITTGTNANTWNILWD